MFLDSHQDLIIVEKDPIERKYRRNSLIRKTNAILGICEQLRFIYDDVYLLPEGDIKYRLTEKLVDAIIMAKKMMDRIRYFSNKYEDNTGHKGKNLIKLVNNHWRVRKRWERKI
jgi:hypothetical protein